MNHPSHEAMVRYYRYCKENILPKISEAERRKSLEKSNLNHPAGGYRAERR